MQQKKKNVDTKKTKPTSEEEKVKFRCNKKLIISIILFFMFFITCLAVATKTTEREKLTPIFYNKEKKVEYKVYLNKNEFYETEYLEMNKAYIASLIKYIDIDFNYGFNIQKISNIDFDYKIIGELVIESNGGNKRYYEKQYTLLDSQSKKMLENNNYNIKENIKIDYDYYNGLANKFRNTYGVDTNSYLNVYLEVISQTDKSLNYKINERDKVNLKIPLSERAIDITFNQDNIEEIKSVIPEGKVKFNLVYLIIEIILFIISIYYFIKCINYLILMMKIPTKYDKYVNKILKEYDRLIVEINTKFDLSKNNIIEVKSFNELLDVRDNLKVPILYYNTVKHEKGIFYIKENTDIYLLNIVNKDL